MAAAAVPVEDISRTYLATATGTAETVTGMAAVATSVGATAVGATTVGATTVVMTAGTTRAEMSASVGMSAEMSVGMSAEMSMGMSAEMSVVTIATHRACSRLG